MVRYRWRQKLKSALQYIAKNKIPRTNDFARKWPESALFCTKTSFFAHFIVFFAKNSKFYISENHDLWAETNPQ